jgi:hypothetical protein
MTTVTGNIGVGTGVPPSVIDGQPSVLLVRPAEVVTTATGKTMLPVPRRITIAENGSFTLDIDPLPDGFAYEFVFSVAGGKWTSDPRYCIVPTSGTVTYKDLEEVSKPSHVGWTQPSWVNALLELIAAGVDGGLTADDVRDIVAAFVEAGDGMMIDVVEGKLKFESAGSSSIDEEAVKTILGESLVKGDGIDIAVEDGVLTISAEVSAATLEAYATLDSPGFTGTPTAPTPDTADDSGALATTEFVQARVGELTKGDVGLDQVDNTSDEEKPVSTATQEALDLKADLASPEFTGTPRVPTATAGTSTTQAASTAFVAAAVAAIVNSAGATLDTLKELADALGNDPNFATTISTQLGLKAPKDSPEFTGTPTAPTPDAADDSTKLATTAFVQGLITALTITSIEGLQEALNARVTSDDVETVVLDKLAELPLPIATRQYDGDNWETRGTLDGVVMWVSTKYADAPRPPMDTGDFWIMHPDSPEIP